jgi:hypothetical protein
MPVLCLRTGRSPKKGYLMYILSLTAATFSPTSRWGGWVAGGGWGESRQTGQKVRSRQKYGRLFADFWPHRPLSIFCLK